MGDIGETLCTKNYLILRLNRDMYDKISIRYVEGEVPDASMILCCGQAIGESTNESERSDLFDELMVNVGAMALFYQGIERCLYIQSMCESGKFMDIRYALCKSA